MMDLETLDLHFERERDRYLEDWKTLLTFPSISTLPAHDEDCRRCAAWLCDHLRTMGLRAEQLDTCGKPVVYADHIRDAARPTVLYYAHYDVQPVDPEEDWLSPPFTPTLRDGRLYARGADDNKGQLFYTLKAIETLLGANALDVNLRILIEGEEESGSRGIAAGLDGWRDRLGADVLLVTDTGTVKSGAPTLIMGLRGIAALTVRLGGPRRDLHSGVHGGMAPNPAQAMARLLAGLFRDDGSIAVDGFYDGARVPTDAERALAARAGFDAAAYERESGVPPVGGESAYTPVERVGFRPSLDINGIHGGYGGHGAKTIIPSAATAKLSLRLVPGQDPDACLEKVCRHLRAHAPAGLRLEISETAAAGPGFHLDPESPLVARAQRALRPLSDAEPAFLWEGASIPIVSALAGAAGAEPLLCGFGSDQDNVHAPNESFSLEQFRQGYRFVGLLLGELAR